MTLHEIKERRTWPVAAHRFGGVPIIATTAIEAARELSRMAVGESAKSHVHLVNAYTLALADKDPEYAALLSENALNFPDGKPISIFSKLVSHSPRLQQIRGPKLFLDVFDVGRSFGVRHYLLGSTPQVLEKLESTLRRRYPGCIIVGTESPPYRVLTEGELSAQDERIMEVRPHIVWVGLGTPKQDKEASRITQRTGLTTIAVGAAFDFAAGEVREAPSWMASVCLEWLFRLLVEPGRLWRRYLFGNIRFIKIAFRSLEKK